MEANNHFNYGTHSSVSVNSGLKLSSGDSVYTNGSSMSFPQQEKNINGEMNVNGSTTVIGSSVPGSHPPTAPYPHMSNHHHQSSMGYDYLWGGQPQYSPAMSLSPGHGMHQKQPPTGVMQQQSQQHFQGHGQYQLNGGMPGSRQPPVAPPPNMTLTGGQYWNRQPMAQHHEMTTLAREPALPEPPHSMSAPPPVVSTPPSAKAATPPRVSAPPAVSMAHMSASGPPVVSSSSVTSTPPRNSAPPVSSAPSPPVLGPPPRLSSPPLMLQGLRPFPVSVSTLPSVVSPPSVSAPPPKPPALPPLLDKSSRPPSVSAPHPVSAPPPVSVAHQTAHTTSAPPAMVSTSTMVSAPPHSMSVPISALQQMVQGSRLPPLTSSPPALFGAPREKFWTSSSMSASAPSPAVSTHSVAVMAPPLAVSRPHSAVSSRSISVSSLSQSVSTRLPAVSASPTVSVSVVSSFLKEVSMPPLTVHGPRALPLSGPPPLTSQTSRAPPLSVPLAVMTAPLVVPSAPPLSAPPPQAPKRMVPPEPEERCMGNMKYMGNMKGPSVEADTVKTSSKIDSAGWRREIRVKKNEDRLKGETWYYSPCGRRMKQFPEVIKYLNRHQDTAVTREHFSFSPRMPVGDFYEERDSTEGVKWCLLANEEVPSMIMAITGRRGRPPNPDKEMPRPRARRTKGGPVRKPGRPPKPKMVDLLSKVDARMLKRLEAKDGLTEEDKEKLVKIKKKMKRKVRYTKHQNLKTCCNIAEAAAQAALAAKKQVERRAQAQRRLEERRRQQMILEELKKPTEDMCLTDHQPLPELSRIPGLVLSGVAFSHCLAVVEFLYSYGKVLGLHIPSDVPSLSTLQEGLLGLGDSQSEVQDLLIKLVEAALHDPGLPPYYQSVKILGEKLVDLELTRSTVSEGLRIFLESHGFDMEVCNVLRTKTFLTLNPDTKAAILGFLVEELNGSNIVISEIDNTLENRATYRKNKWIIEGKLRKLKAALARRTGRSEEELYLEERRRSARVAEEENLSLEESSGPMERGSRRRTPKEDPTNASIPELERQIDKLTKRQVFFRKKLLQSSHSLRAVSLGQDRFRRRYWLLPHLGGVLVEGPEEILGELQSNCPQPSAKDPLPGTASLMSSPRARGRPRKIKPEVELHLRTAKCRRRRRSSKSGGEESGVSLETTTTNGTEDLTQSAFSNCLSQLQGALTNGTEPATGMAPKGRLPEDSVKEMAEKQGQWFNLLPKQPCDKTSLTEPQAPPSKPPKRLPLTPSTLPALAAPLLQVSSPQPPTHSSGPSWERTLNISYYSKPGRRRRRGGSPARRVGARGAAAKRRGRPSSTLFQEIEQQYFTQLVVKPIPASMVRGWWWIKEPEDLTATLQALHPRGIREKVLHKHLAKHMEYLAEVCTRPINDPIFQVKVKEGEALLESLQQPWQVQERALETDVGALRWVEDLEQRVIAADLHLKPYTVPEVDSTRDDLQYYEHDVDPRDDWIVRTKKEWSDLPRVASHPLDLAVLRLANLERNIDRRYLKEPLWNLAEVVRLAPLTPEESQMGQMDVMSEITPRLRTWRQALDRCRSAPQLCLCLLQLEKAIAWERSVVKVTCQVCRKGDNDEYLLLCDGCDRGCHMYCLRPKVTQVPEGDWFCPTCVSKQRTRVKKRRYEDDSSDEEVVPSRRGGASMATRHKDGGPASSSRYSGDGGRTAGFSPAKRRRMTTRNQPDLTYCEIILMEMESHADAWPFLEPVNPRVVPGYRRIIKNPMDFLTMRERLLQGGYCSCEEFAADAHLVFNNCELFNEDTSEVGMAGHSMKRFFENRWAEFYASKDQ
uniref:Bromodomain adjacent to zinc finger domain, 2A n=1 Tax=Salmo trutta TaxID=8032 RepID=A0A674ETP5_SALTR